MYAFSVISEWRKYSIIYSDYCRRWNSRLNHWQAPRRQAQGQEDRRSRGWRLWCWKVSVFSSPDSCIALGLHSLHSDLVTIPKNSFSFIGTEMDWGFTVSTLAQTRIFPTFSSAAMQGPSISPLVQWSLIVRFISTVDPTNPRRERRDQLVPRKGVYFSQLTQKHPPRVGLMTMLTLPDLRWRQCDQRPCLGQRRKGRVRCY
jgi:hypothetical protein